MTAITAKNGYSIALNNMLGDFFKIAKRIDEQFPPARSIGMRWATTRLKSDSGRQFWNPKEESIPVLLEQRLPPKGVNRRITGKESIDGKILEQPIGLNERRQNAGGFAALPAAEATNRDSDNRGLFAREVARIIAQNIESSHSATTGTRVGSANTEMKVLFYILDGSHCHVANELHALTLASIEFGAGCLPTRHSCQATREH